MKRRFQGNGLLLAAALYAQAERRLKAEDLLTEALLYQSGMEPRDLFDPPKKEPDPPEQEEDTQG